MVKITWVVGMMAALSIVACAEQQAPKVASTGGYAVCAAYGDDSHDSVEVILECDRAECERVAASLNRAEGGGYWVEVAP